MMRPEIGVVMEDSGWIREALGAEKVKGATEVGQRRGMEPLRSDRNAYGAGGGERWR